MKNTPKKSRKNSDDAWDNRELGATEKYVRRAAPAVQKALDDHLSLQTISIRLSKELISNLKKLAEEDGIGYQPYVRQLLMRHVRHVEQERRGRAKSGKHIPGAR